MGYVTDSTTIYVDQSWCPQCGPHVQMDEDGCCQTCSADAVGPGAWQALDALRERDEARARISRIREAVQKALEG